VEHFLICSEGKKTLKDYFFKRRRVFKLKIRIIACIISYRDGCPEEILENIKKRKN